MNKLEDDPTYKTLQERLAHQRWMREKANEHITSTLMHINAIKRDFKTYEEENNAK